MLKVSLYPASPGWKRQLLSLLVLPGILLVWSTLIQAGELTAFDCVITPSLTVDVSSPVSGTLASVNVDRSDIVNKNQIIARLNSQVEQAAVTLAKAKADLDADISIGKVNLAFDQEKSDRVNALYVSNMASSQDKDDARRNKKLSKEKLRHARQLYRIKQLELRMAEAKLNQKLIRSPIKGIVVQRFKTKSEHIEDEAIVQIAQINPLYVEAIVPIEFSSQISTHMWADVFSNNFPETPQRAVVTIVDRMGDAASGTFGVRLELPNPDYKIQAGVKCNVQILPDLPLHVADNSDSAENIPVNSIANDNVDAASLSAPVKPGTVTAMRNADLPVGAGNGRTVTSQTCSTLGPYDTAAEAQALLDIFESNRFVHSLREKPGKTLYAVLARPQGSQAKSHEFVARIKKAGIKDVVIINKGQFKTRISLGVYQSEKAHNRRISHIAKKGFDSESQVWAIKSGKWWVDLGFAPDNADVLRLLTGKLDGKQIRPSVCPGK